MNEQDSKPNASDAAGTALWRMIEFKIPLPWLLGGAICLIVWLVNMSTELREVTKSLATLQITVTAGNNQSSILAGEVSLIKFRLEHLEADAARARPPTR